VDFPVSCLRADPAPGLDSRAPVDFFVLLVLPAHRASGLTAGVQGLLVDFLLPRERK
jgi:hypothetical protein